MAHATTIIPATQVSTGRVHNNAWVRFGKGREGNSKGEALFSTATTCSHFLVVGVRDDE